MKFVCLFLLSLIICNRSIGQDTIYRPNRMPTYQVVDNDTIYFYTLPGFNKVEIKDSLAQRKFLKLVRDVRKTLPYAKMAAYRLQLMEQNLALMSDGRQKKAYIKQTEAA
ncbi:MAG: DUF4294 domain-containing protein, partial [Bacteroidia bacterium]|nr:DUF4294 domain-containing protein [Bacteroidia bacterium]